MSLQACAEIVQRGDPDRFAAAMAAPVDARRVLFPLYAFNVEVARAPWVTEEPMIAEMRLQWWRDALEEIAEGKQVRKHEVTSPLAEVLHAPMAESLDRLIQARRWDIYRDAFDDADHFEHYLKMTGGLLMWTTAHLLGARINTTERIFALGKATALVRFLKAVPALEKRGRIPLVDGRAETIATLAKNALREIPDMQQLRAALPKPARGALLEAWETEPLLYQIARNPARVADGAIGLSEFRKRARLARWAL
ncbi:MAG: squalene/phytoene synthase family protein [Boseongicola sp.]|nr:squalene/phytoene synthase family protein [Boseongicola sp.]NNJ68879.1 squalene/phytoene synthase family protein [Boseongicola sp.]